MSKAKIIAKRSEDNIMSEKNILSRINHPFIVNMHFSFQDSDNLYLIMDYLSGGDLGIIYPTERHRYSMKIRLNFFYQIL